MCDALQPITIVAYPYGEIVFYINIFSTLAMCVCVLGVSVHATNNLIWIEMMRNGGL